MNEPDDDLILDEDEPVDWWKADDTKHKWLMVDPFQNSAPVLSADRDSESVKDWITLAAELFAGTSGTVLGSLIGDPAAGTAAGILAFHGLRVAGLEIWERHISKREKLRVAAVIVLAASEMENRLAAGAKLREDDFFKAQPPHNSHAVEVTELLLLKAQREPEERKLPYIANLIASIAFDLGIDVAMAHQLLRFASELSYRQYCILALAIDASSFDLFEGHASSIGLQNLSGPQTSFLSDC
jgi:hypothetical protein